MRNETVQTQEYFEKRSLRKGAAGWPLLMGLGVAYVISGDFSGWNYGIAYGGWLGLAIAFVLMGCMYVCTVLGEAEMSSVLPTAGAGFAFSRCAMGRFGGFFTGMAITVEYVCAPAAISTFIANYFLQLGIIPADFPFLLLVGSVFIIFIGIHIFGVGEALKLMLAITVVGAVALLAFAFGAAPHFDPAALFDIDPNVGSSTALPFGVSGVLTALPFGIWFFLGVEGVALAAEEAEDPRRDIPKAIVGSMTVLIGTGLIVLVLAAGVTGSKFMGTSSAPLVDALNAADLHGLALFVNIAGLFGLVASFFSLIYAGSREIFALSRAGYLPTFLSLTGSRKTPWVALLVQGMIGFGLVVIVQDGDILLNMAVLGACLSYVLMNLSHLVLRLRQPNMVRVWKTPGGASDRGKTLLYRRDRKSFRCGALFLLSGPHGRKSPGRPGLWKLLSFRQTAGLSSAPCRTASCLLQFQVFFHRGLPGYGKPASPHLRRGHELYGIFHF